MKSDITQKQKKQDGLRLLATKECNQHAYEYNLTLTTDRKGRLDNSKNYQIFGRDTDGNDPLSLLYHDSKYNL